MNKLRVCVLASGSKGNCVFIGNNNTKLLIDLGITSSNAESILKELMINPSDIKSILITHTHTDHIAGLKVFIKKYNPTLYLTKKMYDDLIKIFKFENYVLIDGDFEIDDLYIKVIKTSHDTSDSNGYIVEYNDKSVVYITDTGYIKDKNFEKLQNKNVYVMESNHDIEKLMNGKYPYHLKQRILSDSGHLSNKDSGYYLSKFIGDKTKKIFLAHLSDENNDPDLALKTVKDVLSKHNIDFDNIEIAYQKQRTELVEI